MNGPDTPSPDESAAKNRAIEDIEQLKGIVEDAELHEVETPTGVKDVTIAYDFPEEFAPRVEQGQARGVYFEPHRKSPEKVMIDWAEGSPEDNPQRSRTGVLWSEVERFEESEYYTRGDES